MAIYQNIRTALEKHLMDLDYVTEDMVAFENVEFDLTDKDLYIGTSLQPGTALPASIGGDRDILHEGVFLVDVFTRDASGPAAADTLADLIRDAFSPGNVLVDGSAAVNLRFAQRGAGINVPPWYQVPVVIGWYCYSPT